MKAYLRTAKSMASDETKDSAIYAREGRRVACGDTAPLTGRGSHRGVKQKKGAHFVDAPLLS